MHPRTHLAASALLLGACGLTTTASAQSTSVQSAGEMERQDSQWARALRSEDQYRQRHARLQRLHELADERGDESRAAQIEKLMVQMEKRHAQRLDFWESRVGDQWREHLQRLKKEHKTHHQEVVKRLEERREARNDRRETRRDERQDRIVQKHEQRSDRRDDRQDRIVQKHEQRSDRRDDRQDRIVQKHEQRSDRRDGRQDRVDQTRSEHQDRREWTAEQWQQKHDQLVATWKLSRDRAGARRDTASEHARDRRDVARDRVTENRESRDDRRTSRGFRLSGRDEARKSASLSITRENEEEIFRSLKAEIERDM